VSDVISHSEWVTSSRTASEWRHLTQRVSDVFSHSEWVTLSHFFDKSEASERSESRSYVLLAIFYKVSVDPVDLKSQWHVDLKNDTNESINAQCCISMCMLYQTQLHTMKSKQKEKGGGAGGKAQFNSSTTRRLYPQPRTVCKQTCFRLSLIHWRHLLNESTVVTVAKPNLLDPLESCEICN